ncbi:MAG: nucleotide exchange factor GrpE [Thermodesulfobacteriota bacterium]
MNPNDNDNKEGDIELRENGDNYSGEEEEIGQEEKGVPRKGGKDYQDLYQKYIRLAADFENYKKRLAKEKADVISYGNEELIKALLNVIDNLERALDHVDAEEDPKPLIEGVKLVHKQFLSCLEKFGVQFVDASPGQEFDPRLHQAIERVESPDFTPGLIISEMLRGYTLKDRLLRPALVVVSKGAGGAGETDQNQGGAGSGDVFDLTDGD